MIKLIITFLRHINLDGAVETKVTINHEGSLHQIGVFKFPNKLIWSRFYGAIQNGSISMKDLEVRMENSAEGVIPTEITGSIITTNPPIIKED